MKLQDFLKKGNFHKQSVDFSNKKWHHDIPSSSGWYFIETTVPIELLEKVDSPKDGNYHIPGEIIANTYLLDMNMVITQKNKDLYIVYSGEAKNLLNRAREHSFGGKGTGCLALSEYKELKKNKWQFCYLEVSDFAKDVFDDKNLRVYGEQIFRTLYGFPVLCSK